MPRDKEIAELREIIHEEFKAYLSDNEWLRLEGRKQVAKKSLAIIDSLQVELNIEKAAAKFLLEGSKKLEAENKELKEKLEAFRVNISASMAYHKDTKIKFINNK